MKYVSEDIVNDVLDKFEEDAVYLSHFKELMADMLEIATYIHPENFSLLTQEEFALLEYLTCIIYHSVKTSLSVQPKINPEILDNYEEKNWEVFNSTPNKNFSAVLDIFFKGYPQEDLLALVEDAITSDEDTPITIVGAEIIFVTCKSMIDAYHELN
jgi:hypothetical protein